MLAVGIKVASMYMCRHQGHRGHHCHRSQFYSEKQGMMVARVQPFVLQQTMSGFCI